MKIRKLNKQTEDIAANREQAVPGNLSRLLSGLMLVLFVPVLFCVLFIGNYMPYYDEVKANILVPNVILTLIALIAAAVCVWLLARGGKIQMTKRAWHLTDLALVFLFIGFYFFCLWLSRETTFDMSVDQGIVREAAKDVAHDVPFGYQFVFSMNYNNLPITYVLGQLYRLAENWTWFHHDPEYLWVITGCLMVTFAGFCCCEIVKRMTRNIVAVLITFLLYLATVGMSPWKAIPYTDSYGIPFAVLCIWLYLCSRDCRRLWSRMIWLLLALLAGTVGGWMKPSIFIVVLAVLCAEGVRLLETVIRWIRSRDAGETLLLKKDVPAAAGLLCFGLAAASLFYLGKEAATDYVVADIELDYNEEIEATAQYFFFMGTKELTTGGFSTEDYGIFGEFQFSKADRNAACMERAWERIRERGVLGTVYFCLKKLVKSFNDGTFAWTYVLFYEPFPEYLQHDTRVAGYLRSLFMAGGANQSKYDTLAELVWIFTLMGVPWFVRTVRRKDSCEVFPILVTGILLYLMLFESGARYVYVFLPVFVAMSVCGLSEVAADAGRLKSDAGRLKSLLKFRGN